MGRLQGSAGLTRARRFGFCRLSTAGFWKVCPTYGGGRGFRPFCSLSAAQFLAAFRLCISLLFELNRGGPPGRNPWAGWASVAGRWAAAAVHGPSTRSCAAGCPACPSGTGFGGNAELEEVDGVVSSESRAPSAACLKLKTGSGAARRPRGVHIPRRLLRRARWTRSACANRRRPGAFRSLRPWDVDRTGIPSSTNRGFRGSHC